MSGTSKPASIPLVMTTRMRADLADLGYTPDQVAELAPAAAWKLINDGTRPVSPIDQWREDTAELSVAVMHRYARGYPEHQVGETDPDDLIDWMPLSEALTREYQYDAHVVGYLSSVQRRLASDAAITECAPMMVLGMFESDDPIAHEQNIPARPEWREAERPKIERLLAAHPGAYYWETRGGWRIVYRLAVPFEIVDLTDKARWSATYSAWCDYLRDTFGIDADRACADWTRLQRLPRVMRDDVLQTPATIGDPHAIGTWDPPVTVPDVAPVSPSDPIDIPDEPNAPTPEQVEAFVDALAAGWPERGRGRNVTIMAACGWLGRKGYSVGMIEVLLLAVSDRVPGVDEKHRSDCRRFARETADKLGTSNVYGRTKLIELVGEDAVKAGERALGIDIERDDAFFTRLLKFAKPTNANRAATPASIAKPAPRLREVLFRYGVDAADFLAAEDVVQSWIVLGLIPEGMPAMLVGPPKSGKSWFELYCAVCIALGLPVLGRFTTRQCRVLVIAREDTESETRRRVKLICRGLGVNPEQLRGWLRISCTEPLYLDDDKHHASLEATIAEWRPGVVLIDSLSRIHMAEENSRSEMAVVTNRWADLCSKYACTILILHHVIKSEGGTLMQRIRGTGDLGAVVRVAIGFEPKGKRGEVRRVEVDGNLADMAFPFDVQLADVTVNGERVGVKFESIGKLASAEPPEDLLGDIGDMVAELAEALNAAGGKLTVDKLRKGRGAKDGVDKALKTMVNHGLIVVVLSASGKKRCGYRLTPKGKAFADETPHVDLHPPTGAVGAAIVEFAQHAEQARGGR